MEISLRGWKLVCVDGNWFAWMEISLRGWKLVCVDGNWFAWMEISLRGWKLVGVTGNYKGFDLCLGSASTCAGLWDEKAPPAGWNCGGALLV